MSLFPGKQARKNLLEGLVLDAPYVTEMRRILQNLYRQQKSDQTEKRSYMVTSAGRGEGKSTISALMSIVSARIFHKRTLLVDGDLHRPTVHSILGVSRGPGLFEVMQGSAPIHEATHSTSLPLLWVIPSGYPRDAISDSYADERFGQLIQSVRPSYDVIFIDAAPAVPTIEPTLMAEHVDAILLVAMAGRTPLTMARRTMQILAPVADKIAGVVLNNAIEGLPYYFNYSYYGYTETKPVRPAQPSTPRQSEQPSPRKSPNDNGGGI